MKKLEYFIKDIHPVEFFDKKNFDVVKIIKNNFPSVKIIIKGDKGSFIWENDDLYYDNTHYINNEVIEGTCEKIKTSPESNLDLELKFFILGYKPKVNILDIWSLMNTINN